MASLGARGHRSRAAAMPARGRAPAARSRPSGSAVTSAKPTPCTVTLAAARPHHPQRRVRPAAGGDRIAAPAAPAAPDRGAAGRAPRPTRPAARGAPASRNGPAGVDPHRLEGRPPAQHAGVVRVQPRLVGIDHAATQHRQRKRPAAHRSIGSRFGSFGGIVGGQHVVRPVAPLPGRDRRLALGRAARTATAPPAACWWM